MLKVQSESDLVAGLNLEWEASRDTAEGGLDHEENANHVANYVPKENYPMPPNTWCSSKETAETVHKTYQKDTEETIVLKSIGGVMSTMCSPV